MTLNYCRLICRRFTMGMGFILVFAWILPALHADASETLPNPPDAVKIWKVVGPIEEVRIRRGGARADAWDPIQANTVLRPGDRLATGPNTRVSLLQGDNTIVEVRQNSSVEVLSSKSDFTLWEGFLHLFHRGPPGKFGVRTPAVFAGVRGTEFTIEARRDGAAILTLLDGEVELTNPFGREAIRESGGVVVVDPGTAPRIAPKLEAAALVRHIQWFLYYPGVVHLPDLHLTPGEQTTLAESLRAYREGDLLQALAKYPARHVPTSHSDRLYRAAVLLAVGRVTDAEEQLIGISSESPRFGLVMALKKVIASVRMEEIEQGPPPTTGTEWLAHSYYLQSRWRLPDAREAARRSVAMAPDFAFGLARLAELEFSFGDTSRALAAVGRSVALAPRHAQAVSVQGFLLAAQNRIPAARQKFEEAISLDAGLGNAWLGRGLCRIRAGDLAGGRLDLLTAAAAEPRRSLPRSYLAKAFADHRLFQVPAQATKARQELDLARRLDPLDPTPWLYQSLLDREENRVNDSIQSIDRAQALSGNRALYRSQSLLDQDRAVASANQARAYRDAGMADFGVLSAQRAVAADYANPSAHQFLAESYANADPVNLRHETPRVREYLVANLLSPIGAGLLSPALSQQEYSKLFERDGAGLFSDTTYLSRGSWIQAGGARGTFGNSGFLAEGIYNWDPGYFRNNDLEQRSFGLQIKHQAGPSDTFYAQAIQAKTQMGDLGQYYDPRTLDPDVRVEERLEPVLVAGWHRSWSPGTHTLFLAGLVNSNQRISDPTQPAQVIETGEFGNVLDLVPISIDQRYDSDFTLFTAEVQQIWQTPSHLVVGGFRYQHGELEARSQNGDNDTYFPLALPPASVRLEPDLDRVQVYAYETWSLTDVFRITGGLSFDHLAYPENFQYAPLTSGNESKTRFSPKMGFIWEALPRLHLRGGYTRSLGGVSFDHSFGLEPTQVAGFNQGFRGLIPESLAGASSAADFETLSLAIDARPSAATWLSLSAERLASDVTRAYGVYSGFEFFQFQPMPVRERLDYEEMALQIGAAQLLGPRLSLAARYRISHAELDQRPSAVAPDVYAILAGAENDATLHDLRVSINFNHESGAFAAAETNWLRQFNGNDTPYADENSLRLDLWAGYRFARRRAELTLGIMNVTDQDYRLNPVALLPRFERERTFFTRLTWQLP